MANRIALLKQEEMKTWKKIEETKKRTGDITNLKKRNEEKVQKVSIFLITILTIIFCYRKFSTSNLRMSKRDICPKTTTWFPSKGMKKRKKFKMLFFCKRKKKPNKQKWSSNKTSKERDKISSELSRKIRWKIKLVFNQKD